MLLSAGVGRDAAEIRQAQAAGDIADVAGSLAESRFRHDQAARAEAREAASHGLHTAETIVNPVAAEAAARGPEPFDAGVKRTYLANADQIGQPQSPQAEPNPALDALIADLHARGVGQSQADRDAAATLRGIPPTHQ